MISNIDSGRQIGEENAYQVIAKIIILKNYRTFTFSVHASEKELDNNWVLCHKSSQYKNWTTVKN